MLKIFLFSLAFFAQAFSIANIEGLWMAMDDETKKPGCIIAIYEFNDKYYGRILAILDDKKSGAGSGQMLAIVANPTRRATGIKGNPLYYGLDFIWNLVKYGSKFVGNIVDPRNGSVYNAEVWREGKDLVVRGKLWVFGQNQIWHPVDKEKLPKDYVLPDMQKFVPIIPQAK